MKGEHVLRTEGRKNPSTLKYLKDHLEMLSTRGGDQNSESIGHYQSWSGLSSAKDDDKPWKNSSQRVMNTLVFWKNQSCCIMEKWPVGNDSKCSHIIKNLFTWFKPEIMAVRWRQFCCWQLWCYYGWEPVKHLITVFRRQTNTDWMVIKDMDCVKKDLPRITPPFFNIPCLLLEWILILFSQVGKTQELGQDTTFSLLDSPMMFGWA